MYNHLLDITQINALERLQGQINIYKQNASQFRLYSPPTCFPLVTSTLGILGGRGSGKSTLLNHFYIRHLSSTKREHSDHDIADGLQGRVIVLKPIDCSVLPKECVPGMVVLCHILNELRKEDGPLTHLDTQKRQHLLDELEQHIIGLYTRVGEDYYDFSIELSSTPEDFGNFLTRGLNDRLGLKAHLECWLEKLFDVLQSKHKPCAKTHPPPPCLLVVLLDDFDLAHGKQIRNWLTSLLDELCQTRLLFVLTADFYRLEHLNWDVTAQIDDKTGRALLHKILPLQNRAHLNPWNWASRAKYQPSDAKTSDHPILWTLIDCVINRFSTNPSLIYSLLPEIPRGLEGLYHYLKANRSSIETEEDFWQVLATIRGEPLLSRRFQYGKQERWTFEMKLEEREISTEHWSLIVERSAQRAKPCSQKNFKAQYEFSNRIEPLDIVIHEDRENLKANFRMRNERNDPLLHDQLHIRPLRDALEIDRPFWVELLVDKELAHSLRYRSQFFQEWLPLSQRLATAHTHVPGNSTRLIELLEANPSMERSVFYWLNHSGSGFQIGWTWLFSALREARSPLDAKLFSRLLVDPIQLAGEIPTTDALNILPNRLWALVLFADGLFCCPWSAFSGETIWRLTPYLGLAAAFVRSAYAYAIAKAYPERLEEFRFSPAQQRFLNAILARDEKLLLRNPQNPMTEEAVLASLGDLFCDEWEVTIDKINSEWRDKHPDDYEMESLIHAAFHYLHSPVYTSVKALLIPHCEYAQEALQLTADFQSSDTSSE